MSKRSDIKMKFRIANIFFALFIDFDIPDTSWPDSTLSAMDRMSLRLQLLSNVCRTYSDPFRPESIALTEPPRSLGVEVVYLHSTQNNKVSSVCIPHKVDSKIFIQIYPTVTR